MFPFKKIKSNHECSWCPLEMFHHFTWSTMNNVTRVCITYLSLKYTHIYIDSSIYGFFAHIGSSLLTDLFLDNGPDQITQHASLGTNPVSDKSSSSTSGSTLSGPTHTFKLLEGMLSEELVQKVKGVFQFELTGLSLKISVIAGGVSLQCCCFSINLQEFHTSSSCQICITDCWYQSNHIIVSHRSWAQISVVSGDAVLY